jgi:hypothetical protein
MIVLGGRLTVGKKILMLARWNSQQAMQTVLKAASLRHVGVSLEAMTFINFLSR